MRQQSLPSASTSEAWEQSQSFVPVPKLGTRLSTSIWGQAWNLALAQLSLHAGRLPQGRSLLRRGGVLRVEVGPGLSSAEVQDKEGVWTPELRFSPLAAATWEALCRRCQTDVPSAAGLLSGALAAPTLALLTDADAGLVPSFGEIRSICSCLDDASLCAHAAATLYAIGVELDCHPELLFLLRAVPVNLLVDPARCSAALVEMGATPLDLGADSLASIFGLDLDLGSEAEPCL